jgi:hypothetical protein
MDEQFLLVFVNFKLLKMRLGISGQCEVSDQIQSKRSDQIFKSEFKNNAAVYRKKLKANK